MAPGNSEGDSASATPYWDTSPLNERSWLLALSKWLPSQHNSFETLFTMGYTISKGRTVVMSKLHVTAIKDGSLKACLLYTSDAADE